MGSRVTPTIVDRATAKCQLSGKHTRAGVQTYVLECNMHGHQPGVDTAKRTRNRDKTRTSGAAAGLNQPVSNRSAECTLRLPAKTADSLERHYPEMTRQIQTRRQAKQDMCKPRLDQHMDDDATPTIVPRTSTDRLEKTTQPLLGFMCKFSSRKSPASCARSRRKSPRPHVQDLTSWS